MSDRYIMMTAAKDEGDYIGGVIEAVLKQTVRPIAWFIMADGSSDQTAAIVQSYADKHPWIHLQSAGQRGGRNFGSQYKAMMAAYELAKPLEFDFVAVLDADQAFERNDYYETLLGEFHRDSRLGIASGFIYERQNGVWANRRANSEDSVTGGTTLFRRECFDQTGGYRPLFYGGSDWLMQIDARMAGWKIKTRPDQHIYHFRPTSSAGGIWKGLFKQGLMDASFGSHPVFEIFKCCRRVTSYPFVFGGLVRLCGYFSWKLRGRKPLLKPEQVAFLRREQVAKLRRWLSFSSAKPQVGQLQQT